MSSSKRIDGYREIASRGVLGCIVTGLVISGCLSLISFAMPFYKTTPYPNYDIIYYFDQVTYSPDIIDDLPFNQCNNYSYNQNCNTHTCYYSGCRFSCPSCSGWCDGGYSCNVYGWPDNGGCGGTECLWTCSYRL